MDPGRAPRSASRRCPGPSRTWSATPPSSRHRREGLHTRRNVRRPGLIQQGLEQSTESLLHLAGGIRLLADDHHDRLDERGRPPRGQPGYPPACTGGPGSAGPGRRLRCSNPLAGTYPRPQRDFRRQTQRCPNSPTLLAAPLRRGPTPLAVRPAPARPPMTGIRPGLRCAPHAASGGSRATGSVPHLELGLSKATARRDRLGSSVSNAARTAASAARGSPGLSSAARSTPSQSPRSSSSLRLTGADWPSLGSPRRPGRDRARTSGRR